MISRLKEIQLKFILIVVCVFFTSCIYGQTTEDAKLYAIWSDTSKSEINRVDAYFDRLNDWKMIENESNLDVKWFGASGEALRLALKLDKKEYLPLFYLASSFNSALLQNDIKRGCIEAQKILESAKLVNASKIPVFIAYMILSNGCQKDIKEEDVINEFNKIKDSLTDTREDVAILRIINFPMGYRYMVKEQFPKALLYLQESLRLSEELNLYDASYAKSNEILGNIHATIGNYKESKKYLEKSLQMSHIQKDTYNLGSAYIGMAELMIRLKDEVKAQHYIDSAMYIMKNVKKCEDCFYVAKSINVSIKNLSGNYSGALDEIIEIQNHFKGEGDNSLLGEKAKAYLGLKKYDKVIGVLKLLKVTEHTYSKAASDDYDVLAKAYEALGDYQNALKNYKLYVQVEDTLAVWRNSSEVTRLELENRFTKQQLKSELKFQAQLNKQKSTRNWILFLGISAFLIALGLYARLRYTKKTQTLLHHKNEIIEAEKEKAQASERAKHQFLANMSHEIRTPMNAIKGMTDILIRRNPKEEQKEYLEGIKQSSDSLLVIINDILDISKIEAGKVELEHEVFSVNELVNNVHAIMQFKAEEKGLELMKDIPAESLFVKGDANRLRQILINLIGNAIKFTEKGLVTTTIVAKKLDDKINLHFTVSDTGIGIDKDRLDRIFHSFEQAYSDTSRKFGGTGLGLSISKMLVELHDGNIWVESEKGKSSQFHFTITFPKAESAPQESKVEETSNTVAEALKGINILLVEDNQFNVVVAKEELEDAIEDVTVNVAENGLIALEKLKSSKVDIILMDVQMPIMNGYEATKAIRALQNENAKTPIIAMTANVLKEEVDLCYQAGMNDFLGKPFDTEVLIQKMYNLVNTES